MKTIGIDIRLFGRQRTGDEVVFFNLTREVLRLDSENCYRLYTQEDDPHRLATLQGELDCVGNPRVTFISLPGPKNRFFWNAVALPLSLSRDPVDVYHTQYIAPLFLPRSVKLVTHIHDVSFAAHPEWIGRLDRFFLSLLIPRSLRRSAAIVTPSVFTRDEMVKYFLVDPVKICVIPNAVGPEWLMPVTDDKRQSVRQKYRLTGPYFISVGTMQPRKNIGWLIAVFREFRTEHPDVSLVLVGNPAGHHVESAVSAAWIRGEPGVIFTGFVGTTDLPALLAESRGLLFPSAYEGFGLPLLEAFAAGVPVAAADNPCFREVAGDAAFFFPLGSIAELKKILYTLYIEDEPRNQARVKGSQRLVNFSWSLSAQKLRELYRSL